MVFDEPRATDTQKISSEPAQINEPLTLFDSADDRQTVAMGLAISGMSSDQAIDFIQDIMDEKLGILKANYLEQKKHIEEDQVKAISDEIEKRARVESCRVRIGAWEAEEEQLEDGIRQAEIEKLDAWQRIRQNRYNKGKEFFKEKQGQVVQQLESIRDQVKAQIYQYIDESKSLHEIEKSNWEMNKGEFARRVKVCEEEKKSIEDRLTTATKYTDKLQRIGVTRKSATFLFVAGSIALAGTSSVISSMLSDRQPGDGFFSIFMAGIVKNLVDAPSLLDKLKYFSIALGVPVAIIVLLFGVYWAFAKLVDRGVRDSDSKGRKKRKEQKKQFQGRLSGEFSGLASRLAGYTSQFPEFTPLTESGKYHISLLRSFPSFLLAGVVFIVNSGAISNSNGVYSVNISAASIGIAAGFLFTLVAVLYVIKIMEPRWDRAIREIERQENSSGDARSGFKPVSFAGLNKELVVLVICSILALLIAAFLPLSGQAAGYLTPEQFKHIAWGFVSVFMGLSSLGLAYGIIQRGIFHDVDYLQSRRETCRIWIEKYSMQPVIDGSGIFEISNPDETISEFLDKYETIDQFGLLYEMNEVFGDDFEVQRPPDAVTSFWKSLYRNKRRTFPFPGFRLKNSLPDEPRLIDFAISADETKTFLICRKDIVSKVLRKSRIPMEVSVEREEILKLESEINVLNQTAKSFQNLQREIALKHQDEISRIRESRTKEMLRFRAEFGVGILAYDLLKGPGGEPSGPHARPRPIDVEVGPDSGRPPSTNGAHPIDPENLPKE